MRSRMKFLLITVSVLFATCAFLSACAKKTDGYVQQLNYTESVENIDNPDRGFYRPISVKVTQDGATYNANIITSATRLYHLRVDISAFSAAVNGQSDLPLTQAALIDLKDLLALLRREDKNAIVRFAYDPYFGGNKDKEPAFNIMLSHVEQLCPIFDGFENTVTAIEVGMIGPWGEMHTSSIANADHITPLTEAFLTYTRDIPVLVRTPQMIYDYLGISINNIDGYTVSAQDKAYRLGIFNDGYLGSTTDLGTYTDRSREISFLAKQTEHLPFGGEVVTPTSALHDIDVCLPEMNKIHLSYLNAEWNDQVIAKWKNSYYTKDCGDDEIYYQTTAYRYIENHLGYRYVLKNSVFSYTDKLDRLDVELTLENVGFGNLNKVKHSLLILTDESGAVVYTAAVDDFSGNTAVKYSAALNTAPGNYDVYLRLYGEEYDGVPLYCLQFANDGLWNSELKANKIGRIEL